VELHRAFPHLTGHIRNISALVLRTWPDLMQDRGYEVPRTHLFVGTWAKTSELRAEFIRNSSLTTSMRV
jgi:hypothetical protein